MKIPDPIPYRDDIETFREDEAETIEELCRTFDTILETTAKDYGKAVRSVHAKAHGILEGTLTILGDLPEELAQGLFAAPATHDVVLRISTNPGDIVDDAISLPRGLALKVMDVEGDRLPDAAGTTQDFVLVNAPIFQMKNAERFLANLKLLAATTDRAESAKVALSKVLRPLQAALDTVGLASPKIGGMGGTPNTDPLGETYYSATPFRYGDYIAKFGLFPVSQDLLSRKGETIDASDDEDAIRHTIRDEMRKFHGHWDFRVQLCRDLEKHPIEDPMKEWDEEVSPYLTVARLTIEPQDSWEEACVETVNEQRRFSIWTGLAAHRPLGNINRARNAPYRHSAKFRERYNGCPIHEPGKKDRSKL